MLLRWQRATASCAAKKAAGWQEAGGSDVGLLPLLLLCHSRTGGAVKRRQATVPAALTWGLAHPPARPPHAPPRAGERSAGSQQHAALGWRRWPRAAWHVWNGGWLPVCGRLDNFIALNGDVRLSNSVVRLCKHRVHVSSASCQQAFAVQSPNSDAPTPPIGGCQFAADPLRLPAPPPRPAHCTPCPALLLLWRRCPSTSSRLRVSLHASQHATEGV